MLRFKLVPAPVTTYDRLCRSGCGKDSNYVLESQAYSYSYPCCDDAACIEKVKVKMVADIESAIESGVLIRRMEVLPWRWWRNDRKTNRFDPYLT